MFSRIATVLFIVIVVGALAANWTIFIENLPTLGPALIALNIILLLLGGGLAELCGSWPNRKSKRWQLKPAFRTRRSALLVGSLIW